MGRTWSRSLAVVLVLGSLFGVAGCGGDPSGDGGGAGPTTGVPGTPAASATPTGSGTSSDAPGNTVVVTSPVFRDGQPIPRRYSCKGGNVPPPLAWSGIPERAVELALVVDDPDAVGGVYIHWVVTGIDPTASGSPEGGSPPGGTAYPNSGGDRRYLGPCPPAGTGAHHYRFTLYVLGEHLNLDQGLSADRAHDLIAAAATARARLVGTYRG